MEVSSLIRVQSLNLTEQPQDVKLISVMQNLCSQEHRFCIFDIGVLHLQYSNNKGTVLDIM